jgi:hypothetical protein
MSGNLADFRYDYSDSFEARLAATSELTSEQWARAVFEQAPRPVRWLLVSGFRFGLGLRLSRRPSLDHVLGWEIVERQPDTITVASRSWFLTARLVFAIEGSRGSQSTFVRYDRRSAALIWPPVAIVHRQIVPRLVRRAAARAN